MMNVLHLISPTGFYGAERWIIALASHLPRTKTRCDLVITSESPQTRFKLLEEYPNSAGSTHRIELSHRFDPHAISKLSKLIKDESIDIVHSHGYKSDILAVLACYRTSTITVTTPHGYTKARRIKDRVYEFLGKRALRQFNQVVPLSSELERDVLASGVCKSKVRLIDNAVNLDEIDEAIENSDGNCVDNWSDHRSVTKGRRLGYVGQLVPRKRVHLLVQLFDALWQRDSSTTLDIAGDGPCRAELEALVASLPGASSVRFHGFVEDRLSLMQAFDLFIMTSAAEGVPRVMMEAMSLSLPCAAYSIEGISDLLDHNHTGVLAEDDDFSSLIYHCDRVLCSAELANQLGKAAREKIECKHSAQSMAESYQALYEELMELNRNSKTKVK